MASLTVSQPVTFPILEKQWQPNSPNSVDRSRSHMYTVRQRSKCPVVYVLLARQNVVRG